MPEVIGIIRGFIERQKGKSYVESSAPQRFGKGGAAIVDGCLDGAERREAISEVMRVHTVFYGRFGPR